MIRTFKPVALGLVAGVLVSLLFAGCPTAQTPSTTNDNEANNATNGNTSNGNTTTLPRPVTPPNTTTGGTSTSTGGSQGGGDTSGGSGGGGGGSNSSISIFVSAPSSAQKMRLNTNITVTYSLVDPQGAAQTLDLVAARDDDNNNTADGAPVYTQPLSITSGSTSVILNSTNLALLLNNGFGRFVLGVRATSTTGATTTVYGVANVTIDTTAPTGAWISPTFDSLQSSTVTWTIQLTTSDNSSHTVRVLLDPDNNDPESGNEIELVPATTFAAGSGTRTLTPSLLTIPAGTYYYYVILSDGIAPSTVFYAGVQRLGVTNRIIATPQTPFDLNTLTDSTQGAILQGFNFNDLAGSSMASVPDVDGDGRDELVLVSRFGKPNLIQANGVGFGESYMIYGDATRLHGANQLNSVGLGNVSGLVFRGIRAPIPAAVGATTMWTQGVSDVTVIPDMDGDGLAELVFSFPRVESVNLGDSSAVQDNSLKPDISGMGNLEFQANTPFGWTPNVSQFSRGGVVIVSSHNRMMTDPSQVNRQFSRVLDLHEAGQMFTNMRLPQLLVYPLAVFQDGMDPFGCQDCIACTGACPDPNNNNQPPTCVANCLGTNNNCNETFYTKWHFIWDTVQDNQGPGGFLQPWHIPAISPPLANSPVFPYSQSTLDFINPPHLRCDDINQDGTPDGCEYDNAFQQWGPPPFVPFPCTTLFGQDAWKDGASGGTIWTGFYDPNTSPLSYAGGSSTIPPTSIGARILGQVVNDNFGTAVAADGTFLYVSAPNHTSTVAEVQSLGNAGGDRAGSGAVYQVRTNASVSGGVTVTQLWMEPVRSIPDPNDPNKTIQVPTTWPNPDQELSNRIDTSMPVPHQYIVKDVGSLRGATSFPNLYPNIPEDTQDDCPPQQTGIGDDPNDPNGACCGAQAPFCNFQPYDAGSEAAGYYTTRTPEIVGPHVNANIKFVRALGDVNGDGYRDFAVGSENIKQTFTDPQNPTGSTVGGVFIVYSRPPNLEGDYLLEQLSLDPSDANRLAGVFLKGASTGDVLARVFDDAGDFNKDGFADVIVGNPTANSNTGEAIVLLGSSNLISPLGGWTVSTAVSSGHAVHFVGAAAGDQAGANVSTAGDIDGDGFSEILVAAPGAFVGKGAVYLIYGSSALTGDINLSQVGTLALPGIVFEGRATNDQLGAGLKVVADTDPSNGDTTSFSRGVVPLGDIDGDGVADFAISSMLASPNAKTNAGEVYILYGKRGP